MRYTEILYKDTSQIKTVNPTYIDKVEDLDGIDYCKAVVDRIAKIVSYGYRIVEVSYHE